MTRATFSSRLPRPLAKVAAAQGGPSAVVFIALGVILPAAGVGVWSIPIIVGATLVAFVIELWAACSVEIVNLRGKVETLQSEVERCGLLRPAPKTSRASD